MGLSESELTLANSLGYEGYLEYQLNHAAIDDSTLDALLASYNTLTMQPYELLVAPQGQILSQLTEATILRSVLSQRQLYQRMVEFWTDHFNIDINNGLDRQLKTVDDRDVIRPNALGTFPALLSASAHSTAMLFYLDNVLSTAGNPNENYARELLELHSMGVSGGYTQQDVVEVARCLTGWTMYAADVNPQENRLTFRYSAGSHDNGTKTLSAIFNNQVIPAGGGMNDGLTILNILSAHSSTAQFISSKMCKWFWGESPPQSLVDAVAATFTNTGGDIKDMIRTIFCSSEAASAPPKYKRPYHLFMSALRATNATITATTSLRQVHLTGAGHSPFFWQPPDGYPDTLDYWVGLILPRWNFAALLPGTLPNNIQGLSVDINAFFPGDNTAAAVMNRIDQKLFGGAMPAGEKAVIQAYMPPNAPTTQQKRDALGLSIASPGFQWY
jgi:uncharacterized protein (DUF1800 family)